VGGYNLFISDDTDNQLSVECVWLPESIGVVVEHRIESSLHVNPNLLLLIVSPREQPERQWKQGRGKGKDKKCIEVSNGDSQQGNHDHGGVNYSQFPCIFKYLYMSSMKKDKKTPLI
jgi:hypothetical protein